MTFKIYYQCGLVFAIEQKSIRKDFSGFYVSLQITIENQVEPMLYQINIAQSAFNCPYQIMLSESFQAINNFKKNQKASIAQMQDPISICQICLTAQNIQNCYSVGCQHLFCRSCLVSHISQQISNYQLITCCQEHCNHIIDYSQKSVYHVLDSKTQKLVDAILSNYRRISTLRTCSGCRRGILTQSVFEEKIALVCNECGTLFCYNCFQPHHDPIISCTSAQKIQLPLDCQQCQKCHSIIQKQLGCLHMKCICGYQFCFQCGFHWDQTHICEHKLAKRTGISLICCNFCKILLAVPLLLFLGLFMVAVVLAVSTVSSMLSGIVFWQYIVKGYLLKKNGKVFPTVATETSQPQIDKDSGTSFSIFVLTILWILMLPVCFVVIGAIGFFLPLVNLFHEKQYVLKPSIIKDLAVLVQDWIYLFKII